MLPAQLDSKSFAFNDIIGQDKWFTFVPSFTSLTTTGTLTTQGRARIVGKEVEFQAQFSATTISSTAGVTYMPLPIAAKGLSGEGMMTNNTSSISVGICHISVSSSRLYLPTQTASGNTFNLFGKYEI